MVYRFRVTLSKYGSDEAHAERILEAFYGTHPEVGAVVSQNVRDDTLTVVFSLAAEDPDAAIERGREIFRESGTATGLPMTDVLEINLSLVPADEQAEYDERELQPA